MYINKMHIQNYRNYSDFTMNFHKGLNVIIGSNNSGKTGLLYAINLLNSPSSISVDDFNKNNLLKYGELYAENAPEIVIEYYISHRIAEDDTSDESIIRLLPFLGIKEFEENRRESLNEKIIEINARLKADEKNHENFSEISKDYEKQVEMFTKWKKMKEMVGKKDGSDFLSFVEGLVFKKLLDIANIYLEGITNRFKLVQTKIGSLDFEVKDINFSEPRAISNLSGGERFIISLSLALGISKFASRKVKVDCLFLDEGFGTLSGSYLTESVNALKRLSRENKMLGIITHVEAVINEFPQRILVKKLPGGTSSLSGSGISQGEFN